MGSAIVEAGKDRSRIREHMAYRIVFADERLDRRQIVEPMHVWNSISVFT